MTRRVCDNPPPKPVIGIVGGIGAGKSAAAGAFADLGCRVIDADAVGHEVIDRPDVSALLRQRWGDHILATDGRIDRSAVGRIVFGDGEELAFLNGLMHPLIREVMAGRIADAQAAEGVPAVVLDAPLLFESGCQDLCTHIIFVAARPEVLAERVAGRLGWNPETIKEREKFQIPLDRKSRMCDYIIDNSSSVSHLREQVGELFRRIVHPAC